MTKAEHPLEECIGMFHHGSNTGYTDIPADILQRQCMSSYGSIHYSIDTPAFKDNISLIPVTYNSGKNRKESGKFAHVSTMRKLTRVIFTILKERKKWKYESPALTQSKISKLEVA